MILPVSIIIPTRNRQTLLNHLLPSYIAQNCAEIIVVDDFSWPPFFSHFENVKVVRAAGHLQQQGAKALGLAHASQPLIFFCEDDAYPAARCVENLLYWMDSGGYDGVSSAVMTTKALPGQEKEPSNYKIAWEAAAIVNMKNFFIDSDYRPFDVMEVPFMKGPALLKRQLVRDIGFDTNYEGNAYCEETDFYL